MIIDFGSNTYEFRTPTGADALTPIFASARHEGDPHGLYQAHIAWLTVLLVDQSQADALRSEFPMHVLTAVNQVMFSLAPGGDLAGKSVVLRG